MFALKHFSTQQRRPRGEAENGLSELGLFIKAASLRGRARELLQLPHSDFLTRLDSCKNDRASSLIKDQSQTNRRAALDEPSKPILLIQQAHWGGAGVWRHYDSGRRRNALGCSLFCSSMCFHPKSDRRSTCLILSVYNSARTYNRNSFVFAAGTELTLTGLDVFQIT